MAYTKIIKVKSNLNLCLDYTSNPMKTERRSAEDLNKLLNYTQNNDKTEHQLYVSGFNCIPQNAYEIMMETKTRWRKPVKDGNILAYHIIQSFAPGEATPDQVHQIGCEFVQRFLADRFECTVSTHLDRGHLHNHIVVNSVSYADGRMFRSDFNTYYKGIRKTSDELCRENRLSVIETDGKGKSYDEWLSGQAGKPTIRGMVRKDVEQAIAAADSFDGLIPHHLIGCFASVVHLVSPHFVLLVRQVLLAVVFPAPRQHLFRCRNRCKPHGAGLSFAGSVI